MTEKPIDGLDPTKKISPDIPKLVDMLARHEVVWLLAGSYVLTLNGAKIVPNDLDVVVRRDPQNLLKLSGCLAELDAIPYWSGDPEWDLGTVDDHKSWRPVPATIKHLDQLFVTRYGMLDIPFKLVPDYANLICGCSRKNIAGHWVDVCDPRSVLVALESRRRKKDIERQAIYTEMRRRFGLPPAE